MPEPETMKEKLARQYGKNRVLESSRRIKEQWEHKRAELKPDPEALRSWRAGVEWDRKGIPRFLGYIRYVFDPANGI